MKSKRVAGIVFLVVILALGSFFYLMFANNSAVFTGQAQAQSVRKVACTVTNPALVPSDTDESHIETATVGMPITLRIPAGTQADLSFSSYDGHTAQGVIKYNHGYGSYNFTAVDRGPSSVKPDSHGHYNIVSSNNWKLTALQPCK